VAIDHDQLQRFTVNELETKPPASLINGEPAPISRREISYNMIGIDISTCSGINRAYFFADQKLFNEIQTMESFGDFGNKIQALVRHLLYLQMTDPGAKSIVFSAWADSLHSRSKFTGSDQWR
jgi:E3 ubiquitin-protein ligase SHPRH